MDRRIPFRAALIDSAGTEFANAIFQTTTGHFGSPAKRA
jgi:hypothetical protein